MAWTSTLGLLAPFMLVGAGAGLLFGLATGQVGFYTGMGFAAGSAMGAAWVVRVRRQSG